MATTNDVQFLFSCIRFTDGGKIDFEAVRKECSIVTKGAAAKRYDRLRKKFGTIDQANGDTATADANDAATTAEQATPKIKAKATKKRKLKAEEEGDQSPVKAEEE